MTDDRQEIEESITVSVRIRPLSEAEKSQGATNAWNVIDGQTISATLGLPLNHTFDCIFDGDATTEEVFDKIGTDLVSNVLKGMNGTLFAYGQTASGKTHTMEGNNVLPGVLPLSVDKIFDMIDEMPHFQFMIHVSYIEIFNEQVKDLLSDENKNLRIREDPENGFFVDNLSTHSVISIEEILELKKRGEQRRHVGETSMNIRSSRSHTIFTLKIEMRDIRVFDENNLEEQKYKKRLSSEMSADDMCFGVLIGKLNLVDLAGSENAKLTQANGERLTEAANINRSLLTLSRVISQLSANGDQFINWRDSKLTQILQPSLRGNCKTSVICCIRSGSGFLEESKSTLNFAAKTKNIKNKVHVNEVLDGEGEIQKLKNTIKTLEGKLKTQMEENDARQDLEHEIKKLKTLVIRGGGEDAMAAKLERRKKMRMTWCPGKRRVSFVPRTIREEDNSPIAKLTSLSRSHRKSINFNDLTLDDSLLLDDSGNEYSLISTNVDKDQSQLQVEKEELQQKIKELENLLSEKNFETSTDSKNQNEKINDNVVCEILETTTSSTSKCHNKSLHSSMASADIVGKFELENKIADLEDANIELQKQLQEANHKVVVLEAREAELTMKQEDVGNVPELEKKNDELNEKIKLLEQSIKEIREEYELEIEELIERIKESEDLRISAEQALQKNYIHDSFKEVKGMMNEELLAQQLRMQDFMMELSQEKHSSTSLAIQVEKLETRNTSLLSQIGHLEKENALSNDRLKENIDINKRKLNQIEELQQKTTKLEAELREKQEDSLLEIKAMEVLRNELKSTKEQLRESESKAVDAMSAIEVAVSKNEELKKKMQCLEKRLAESCFQVNDNFSEEVARSVQGMLESIEVLVDLNVCDSTRSVARSLAPELEEMAVALDTIKVEHGKEVEILQLKLNEAHLSKEKLLEKNNDRLLELELDLKEKYDENTKLKREIGIAEESLLRIRNGTPMKASYEHKIKDLEHKLLELKNEKVRIASELSATNESSSNEVGHMHKELSQLRLQIDLKDQKIEKLENLKKESKSLSTEMERKVDKLMRNLESERENKGVEVSEVRKKLEVTESLLRSKDVEVENLKLLVEKLQTKLKQLEYELVELKEEKRQSLVQARAIDDLKEKIDRQLISLKALEAKNEFLQKDKKDKEEIIALLENNLTEEQHKIEEFQRNEEECSACTEKAAEILNLRLLSDGVKFSVETSERKIVELTKNVKELKSTKQELNNRLLRLVENKKSLESDFVKAQETEESLKLKLKEQESIIQESKEHSSNLSTKLESLETAITEANNQERSLREQLESKQKRIARLERAKLTKERVDKFLLIAKEKDRLKALLSDLVEYIRDSFEVDESFDVSDIRQVLEELKSERDEIKVKHKKYVQIINTLRQESIGSGATPLGRESVDRVEYEKVCSRLQKLESDLNDYSTLSEKYERVCNQLESLEKEKESFLKNGAVGICLDEKENQGENISIPSPGFGSVRKNRLDSEKGLNSPYKKNCAPS